MDSIPGEIAVEEQVTGVVKREIKKTQTNKTAVLYLYFSERYSVRENLQY